LFTRLNLLINQNYFFATVEDESEGAERPKNLVFGGEAFSGGADNVKQKGNPGR
jgi:hypothetical protein